MAEVEIKTEITDEVEEDEQLEKVVAAAKNSFVIAAEEDNLLKRRKVHSNSPAFAMTKMPTNKKAALQMKFGQQRTRDFMPGARCGEIFVANNARQWTFICTFCNKSTRDIGDFICHIKMKHLELSDYSDAGQSYYDNDEDDMEADVSAYSQEQDYLDCGSYLDVNMHTEEPGELSYNGRQQHKQQQQFAKKPGPKPRQLPPPPQAKAHVQPKALNIANKYKTQQPQSNQKSQQQPIKTKNDFVVDLLDDEVEDHEDDTTEDNVDTNEIDIERKITAHTSQRPKANGNETAAASSRQTSADNCDYADEQYPHAAGAYDNWNNAEDNNEIDDDEDDDYDNQLLIAPGSVSDALDISVTDLEKNKRRQIRGTAYCSICNKTFQYYSLYRNHMIKHSNETPYTCQLCKKGFKSKQAIRYHMHTHQKEKKYQCQVCPNGYYTENQFITHVLTHENESTFPCMVCGKILRSDKERDVHLTTHTEERPFRCEFCNKLFRLRHHLSNHLKMHRQYRCDYCKGEFTSAVHLRKPYACPGCENSPEVKSYMSAGQTESSSANPMELFEAFEPPQQPTECVDLAEMVSDSEEEDEGMLEHDDQDENESRSSYNLHAGYAASSKKRFKCKYCHRSYSHLSGMNYHIRSKHC